MSAESLLNAAKSILSSGANWIQGSNAVDSAGLPCSALADRAVKFDVQGALIRAWKDSGDIGYANLQEAYKIIKSKIPPTYKNRDMESYNDFQPSFTHVGALFGDDGGEPVQYITVLATGGNEMLSTEDDELLEV